jgi:hypothetical protein
MYGDDGEVGSMMIELQHENIKTVFLGICGLFEKGHKRYIHEHFMGTWELRDLERFVSSEDDDFRAANSKRLSNYHGEVY